MQQLAAEYNVELLSKVIFSFSPDIIMSPLALPRHLLDPWLDELIASSTTASMRDLLTQLKTRPVFEQQWPDTYQSSLSKGKARVLKLESIRPCTTTMQSILNDRKEIGAWFNGIA
jgi:hypothetical protein